MYIKYKVLGWILPSRVRSVIMTVLFLGEVIDMQETKRLGAVLVEARHDVLPWRTGAWQMFWGTAGIVPWSLAVWGVYNYMPELGLFSTPVMIIDKLSDKIWFAMAGVLLLFAMAKQGPGWSRLVLGWCGRATQVVMERFVRTPIFGVLVRLVHVHDGILIEGRRKSERRGLKTLRPEQAPELPYRAAYQYQALKEGCFRLLRVRRLWVLAPLECELVIFDLDAKIPEYTAVSYAWGPDPARPKAISVSGKRLQVTESAYQVVHDLTPEKGERYIWVDFICINQEDMIERASQVRLMGRIYAEASQVNVILNTVTPVDCDDSDRFVHHLNKLNAQLERSTMASAEYIAHYRKIGTSPSSPGWQALVSLFKREYWTRAWIVQEIVMAQKLVVVYGDNELPWEEISKFAKAFQDPENNSALDGMGFMFSGGSIPLTNIMKITQISNIRDAYRAGGLDMQELLYLGWQFKATDPRDNIFAFQGLTRERIPQDIQPNYQQSALDLFLNAAIFQMKSSDRPIWFLSLAGQGFGDRSIQSRFCSLEDHTLPSWVPNWSHGTLRSQFALLNLPRYEPKSIGIDPTGRVLYVEAISYDTIVHIAAQPIIANVPATLALELPPDALKRILDVGKDFEFPTRSIRAVCPRGVSNRHT